MEMGWSRQSSRSVMGRKWHHSNLRGAKQLGEMFKWLKMNNQNKAGNVFNKVPISIIGKMRSL